MLTILVLLFLLFIYVREDTNVIQNIVEQVLEEIDADTSSTGFWGRNISRLFSLLGNHCPFLRVFFGVLSAISGIICFTRSSFFELQFNNNKTSEIVFLGALCFLLVLLVSIAPKRLHFKPHFSAKLGFEIFFLLIVWLLSFLMEFPRFDINSKHNEDSCFLGEQGKKASHGSQFTLYSVGAFSFLTVLLSSQNTQKQVELGFFAILIGLIMDRSMEITTSEDRPNFLYISFSCAYCVGLVLLKRYLETPLMSLPNSQTSVHEIQQPKEARYRTCLVFSSALLGIVFLHFSSFSENQFQDSASLKGVSYITLTFLLVSFLWKAQSFINALAMKCRKQYLAKAALQICLLFFLSVIMYLTEYPRFDRKHPCKDQENRSESSMKKLERNQFDVYSTGLLALFALAVSSGKEQPVSVGIFMFLLELTMNSSIKILGNDNELNFLGLIFSGVYCALLILVRTFLDSLVESDKGHSVWHHGSYQKLAD